jgi:small subunit ribosomal protein S1
VSRRALREGEVRERADRGHQANSRWAIKVKGRVVSVRDHGIFVDLGGVEGRIQLTELSHDRGARPQDVAKVGDEIEAQVLRIDIPTPAPRSPRPEAEADRGPRRGCPRRGRGPAPEGDGRAAQGRRPRPQEGPPPLLALPEGTPRVELSRRAAEPDPWADVHKRYPVGSVHKGKVARMQPFGAFIELEKGVDGLLHVSEIGDKRINHPNEVLQEAQEVTVRVTKIDRGSAASASRCSPRASPRRCSRARCSPRPGMVTTAKIVEHDGIGVWLQLANTIGKAGRGSSPRRLQRPAPRHRPASKASPWAPT